MSAQKSKSKVMPKSESVRTIGRLAVKHARPVLKAAQALQRAKMFVGDYVKVPGKDVKDAPSKDDDEVQQLTQQLHFLRSAARSALGSQRIKVKLYFTNTISSGAGLAITGFYGIIPSSSSEWASLIALYDECRVDAVHIRHIVGVTTAPASAPAGALVTHAIGYDPTYNTFPTGVPDVQESQFQQIGVAACGTGFSFPVTPVGFHSFRFSVPHDTVVNDDMKAKPNFPGSWASCLDTADSFGYIRYYCSALGGAGILSWYQNMEVDMEFRIRT